MDYEGKAPLRALPSLSDFVAAVRPLLSRGAVVFSPLAKISTESRQQGRLSLDKLLQLFHVKQLLARSIFLGRVNDCKAAAACNLFCGGYIVKNSFVPAATYVCVEVVRMLRCDKQI